MTLWAEEAACKHGRVGGCALCDLDPPYQYHRETSVVAAHEIKPTAGTLRAEVLAYIKAHGPCCDERISDGLGMNPSTERPRRGELEKAGLIVASGTQRTRSGRKAVAWALNRL